jgi:hypothetical protein
MRIFNITTNKIELLPKLYRGIFNYNKLDKSVHHDDGFYDLIDIQPDYDFNTEKVVVQENLIDHQLKVVTIVYSVEPLTQVEIENLVSIEDRRITASQGMTLLHNMGLLDIVNSMIETSDNPILKIFWDRSVYWDKFSPTIKILANQLNIDLDVFFEDAKNINL